MRNIFKKIFITIASLSIALPIANSAFVLSGTSSNDINITTSDKVPVCYNATTNTKYMTLEKAMSKIRDNESVYVYIGSNINCGTTITIPSTAHLYLPFVGKSGDSSKTGENIVEIPKYKMGEVTDYNIYGNTLGDANASNVLRYRSILLNMINGADIIVNGSLHVGGIHASFGNNGYYSEINLSSGSSIVCNAGSVFDCFGYIKESYSDYKNPSQPDNKNIRDNSFDSDRFIKIDAGSTLNTYLAMYDISSGGGVTTLIAAKQCPFSTYDFQALQTYLFINSGSFLNADAFVMGPGGMNVNETLPILRQNINEESLFYIQDGEVAFENFNIGDPRYSSRGIATAKTFFTFKGRSSVGYLYLKKGTGSVGITLDTREMFLPISVRMDMAVDNNNVLDVDKKIKFLLGSSFTVFKGSTLNINNSMIFYTKEASLPYSSGDSINYNYNGETAKLVINGSLNFNTDSKTNGSLGAIITHTNLDNSSNLDFSTINESSLSVTSVEGVTDKKVVVKTQGLSLKNDVIENNNFLGGQIYSSASSNGKYYWSGTFYASYNVVITITTVNNPVFSYTLTQSKSSDGANASTLASSSITPNSFNVNEGYYINLSISRASGYKITNNKNQEIAYVNGSWILVNQDLNINIIPNEGVKVGLFYEKDPSATNTNKDWNSGAGHITVNYLESDNVDGPYIDVGSTKINQFISIAKNKYFKFNWITENDGIYNQSVNKNGVITTDPSSFKPTPTNTYNGNKNKDDSGAFLAGGNYKITMYWNYKGFCLIEGTTILMGDNSTKFVENVHAGDIIKVFNHGTGTLENSVLAVNVHDGMDPLKCNIINIVLSNGNTTRISYEHGFYDTDENKYFYINETNYLDCIGKRIYSVKNEHIVTITNCYLTNETVRFFSPISYKHLNIISDGMLSIAGDMRGVFNYFELDKDMKVDKEKMNRDIEKYGLYSYEEWKEYLTYEQFDAFNVKYFKVSIGKGLVTKEEIIRYITSYL